MKQPQVCDHCGGHFGLVTHRWWSNKFCKRTCKDAHLRELALGRDQIRRWFGFLGGDGFKSLIPDRPNHRHETSLPNSGLARTRVLTIVGPTSSRQAR